MRRRFCAVALSLLAACATAPPTREIGASEPPVAAPAWTPTPMPAPLPAVAASEPRFHERRLANGLRVVVVEHHQRPIVQVRLTFPTGAAAEPSRVAGVTSMALALLCDRFERRNDQDELIVSDEKSARRNVADIGGALRPFVGPDVSGLGIDGYASDAHVYLRTINNIVQSRRHGIDAFVGRRNAILDAIDDLELGDDATMFERLFEAAFGKQHPYARRIAGTRGAISDLGMEDVIDLQGRLLHPQGAVLLVVGDVDPAATLTAAAAIFGPWSMKGPRVETPVIKAPPVTKRQAVVVIPRRPARTTALCAARSLSDSPATDAAVAVLSEVLGASRLHDALREGPGLTYSTSAEVLRYRHAQAMFICTRLPTKDTTEGLRIFLRTLATMRSSPPTEAEVERAKAVLISRARGRHDDVATSTQTWLTSLALGESASVAEQADALRAVTASQLAPLADQLLKADWLQLVLSGDPPQIEMAIAANELGKAARLRAAHE